MVKKVIIDTDPGIDDSIAIMLAIKSPEIEILGFTVEPGNVDSVKGAKNIVRVLDFLGADEWLYKNIYVGAKKPLVRDLITGEWVHGSDGLGDAGLPPPSKNIKFGGIEFLINTLMSASKNEVTIISLAPLTNIALAAMLKPEIVEKVNELIIMGGTYGLTPYSAGNVTPVSEYNIFADPEAARIVFNLFNTKIKAIGLDITHNPKALLTKGMWENLAKAKSRSAKLTAKITERIIKLFGGFVFLHDPIAMVSLIKPTYFKFKEYPVTVSTSNGITRGQTIIERRYWLEHLRGMETEPYPYISKPKILIAVDADFSNVIKLIMDKLMEN